MGANRKYIMSKRFLVCSIIYLIACLAICCLPACLTRCHAIDYSETGQIGDTIGGIMGPFIAMIAAYLTFIAFWVQKQANEAQRQDIKQERFNSNFYNLLNIHEQITNSLEYNTYERINSQTVVKTCRGREIFQYTYNEVLQYDDHLAYVGRGMRGRIAEKGIESYMQSALPTYFDHYFRNMYRIIKYVDETDVFDDLPLEEIRKKKYEYIAILRSTLSRYELVWLFYNTLSEYGRDKFKPLVEKYALLNNIRVELLVDSNDVHLYDSKAFGKKYPEKSSSV